MTGQWNGQIRQWMQITYTRQVFLLAPFSAFAWGVSLYSPFHGMTALMLIFFVVDRIVETRREIYEVTAFLPFDLEEYRQYTAKKAGTASAWKTGGIGLTGFAVTLYLGLTMGKVVFDGYFWYQFLFFVILLLVFFMQNYLSVLVNENAKYRKWRKKHYCKQCLPNADRVLYNLAEGLFYLMCLYILPVLTLPGGEDTGGMTEEISWNIEICLIFSGLVLIVNGISFVQNKKQMLETTGAGDYNAKDGVE